MMAGFGIPQEAIASLLVCDLKTLRKHYRYELDNGATEANMRVAQALYLNATRNNNTAAQIWWTKCRMGWYPAGPENVEEHHDLLIDFRWADSPAPQVGYEDGRTIDSVAEATDTDAPEVVWQSGNGHDTQE